MHIVGAIVTLLIAIAVIYAGYCMVTHKNPLAPFMKKPPANPFA